MASIGSIGGLYSSALQRLPGLNRPEGPALPTKLPEILTPQAQPGAGFGDVIGSLVGAVDEKQKASAALTQDTLLGKADNLHQSVIAMQEAGVAFQLMVEVRNKVIESYQELMRMPV